MEPEKEITKSENQSNNAAEMPYSGFQLPEHMRKMMNKLIMDRRIRDISERLSKVEETEAYDVMASASDEATGVSFQEREGSVAEGAEFDDPEGIPI